MSSSQYTKTVLSQQLKLLLDTKPLEEISVLDIAEGCGISRNTFYYHFQDKYDLVNWIFRTECSEYLRVSQTEAGWASLYDGICQYLQENTNFVRAALRYSGQNSLRDYLYDTIYQYAQLQLRRQMRSNGQTLSEEELRFIAEFCGVSAVGLLVKWAKQPHTGDLTIYRRVIQRMLNTAWMDLLFPAGQSLALLSPGEKS